MHEVYYKDAKLYIVSGNKCSQVKQKPLQTGSKLNADAEFQKQGMQATVLRKNAPMREIFDKCNLANKSAPKAAAGTIGHLRRTLEQTLTDELCHNKNCER